MFAGHGDQQSALGPFLPLDVAQFNGPVGTTAGDFGNGFVAQPQQFRVGQPHDRPEAFSDTGGRGGGMSSNHGLQPLDSGGQRSP